MGINVAVTVPSAGSVTAQTTPPSLYVGVDVDRSPFRPPVSPRRGWRIVVGAPVEVAAFPAAATATAVAPQLYLGEDIAPGSTVFPFLFPSSFG